MGGRLLLFVLAAATNTLSPWLAAGLLALSVPLPWMAVLIANDAPARRLEDAHRVVTVAPVRQLENRSHVVIDAPTRTGPPDDGRQTMSDPAGPVCRVVRLRRPLHRSLSVRPPHCLVATSVAT